jgi:hypothetical protein
LDADQLKFNLAIRDWATEKSYVMVTTGNDEKLAIKYKASNDLMDDESLQLLKTGISQHISRLAFENELAVDLDFTDLGYGDLAVFVTVKPAMSKAEASSEYLDLLYLGPRMTAVQFQRLNALRKKYGFI